MSKDHKEFYLADFANIVWRRKLFIFIGTFITTLLAVIVILLSPKSYSISGIINTDNFQENLKHLEYIIRDNYYFYNVAFSDKDIKKQHFDTLLLSFPKDKKAVADFYHNKNFFNISDLNSFSVSFFPNSNSITNTNILVLKPDVDGIKITIRTKNKKNLTKYYKLMEAFTKNQIYNNAINIISLKLLSSLEGTMIINKADFEKNMVKLDRLKEKKNILNKYKKFQYLNSQIRLSEELIDFLPAPLQLQSIEIKILALKNTLKDLKKTIKDLDIILSANFENKFSIKTFSKLTNKLKSNRIKKNIKRIAYVHKKLKNIKFDKYAIHKDIELGVYLFIAFILSLVFFIFCTFLLEWYTLNKKIKKID